MAAEDVSLNSEDDESSSADSPKDEVFDPNIIVSASEAASLTCGIAYENIRLQLADITTPKQCNVCQEDIEVQTHKIGTALHLTWVRIKS